MIASEQEPVFDRQGNQVGVRNGNTIDLNDGSYHEVATFPGFTRGLAFWGPLAFVGLSQVRETATFSDFPLVERLSEEERTCGVWVLNIQTGQTLGFVRFEDALQEIFAVEVLPGMQCPDLLNEHSDTLAHAYVLDDQSLSDVPSDCVSPGTDVPPITRLSVVESCSPVLATSSIVG